LAGNYGRDLKRTVLLHGIDSIHQALSFCAPLGVAFLYSISGRSCVVFEALTFGSLSTAGTLKLAVVATPRLNAAARVVLFAVRFKHDNDLEAACTFGMVVELLSPDMVSI